MPAPQMVMMPPGAAGSRAAQKSALAGVVYDKETDAELGSLLKALLAAGEEGQLDEWQRANVRDAHKNYVKATAVPKVWAPRTSSASQLAELGNGWQGAGWGGHRAAELNDREQWRQSGGTAMTTDYIRIGIPGEGCRSCAGF
eukprot:364227-Chlamydomonas_euryale.AAC.7